jgi:hypothetical protein
MASVFAKPLSGLAKIRALGITSVALASCLLGLALLNLRSGLTYGAPKWWPPLLVGAFYWGLLGFGMIYYRKWAASIFTTSTAAIGVSMVLGSIWLTVKTGNLWALVNIPYGVALCLPLVPTVLSWRELR